MMVRIAALAGILSGLATCALAQDKDWDLRLGAGATIAPAYEGSDRYKLGAMPFLQGNYRDRVFLNGPILGANLVSTTLGGGSLKLGPLARYDSGRDQDDDKALKGLGNIDGGLDLGGFARYANGPWSLGLSAYQNVTSTENGLTAEVEGAYSQPLFGKLRGTVSLAATWADRDYMRTHFGISAVQSRNSGYRPFDAGAGFKDASATLGLTYPLGRNWMVFGQLRYKRLLGDAADSPIVSQAGSADQYRASIFLMYRF